MRSVGISKGSRTGVCFGVSSEPGPFAGMSEGSPTGVCSESCASPGPQQCRCECSVSTSLHVGSTERFLGTADGRRALQACLRKKDDGRR